jgi:hypothetical protein
MKTDDELANARKPIKALLERLAANEHELVALRTARDIAFDTFTQRKRMTVNLMP